jgi:hypothetical protein
MTTPHVSALMIDALALGAIDPEAAAGVQSHLAICAQCRGAQQEAADLRARFLVEVFPGGLRATRSRAWRWLAIPALAALLLVIAWSRRPDQIPLLAVKGDATWQVFAHRDGHTFAVHDGTELAAGDRLRFAVLLAGAHYLLVASVDGSGAVTIYHPYEGTQSAPVSGDRFELAGSIVLDAAPGPEQIYALLSDQPLAAEDVRAQLRGVAAGGPAAIRATRTLAVPARAQLSIVFEKASR